MIFGFLCVGGMKMRNPIEGVSDPTSISGNASYLKPIRKEILTVQL